MKMGLATMKIGLVTMVIFPSLLFTTQNLSDIYNPEWKLIDFLDNSFLAKMYQPQQDTPSIQGQDTPSIQGQDTPSIQEFINTFMVKYPNVTEAEVSQFFQFKEDMYKERMRKIQAYCKVQRQGEAKFSMAYDNVALVYDDKNRVSYCLIPKIASTTWCSHFLKFANLSQEEEKYYINHPHDVHMKDVLFPFVNPATVVEDWKKTTSIVIVRHPMSRLASLYYNKFATHPDFPGIKHQMIEMFRENKSLAREFPTPEESIRYLLWELKEKQIVDFHWRQEHKNCPFCLLNFTIYARVEDMSEDTVYFGLKTGLADKMNIQTRANSGRSDTKEGEFWSAVNMSVIAELAEPWAYRHDFLMFGYSIRAYLKDLNMQFDENTIPL